MSAPCCVCTTGLRSFIVLYIDMVLLRQGCACERTCQGYSSQHLQIAWVAALASIISLDSFNAVKTMLQIRQSTNTREAANQEAQPFNSYILSTFYNCSRRVFPPGQGSTYTM